MPLVRIDAPTTDPTLLTGLGEAVHDALVTAIGVPPDDRFQVLSGGGRVSDDPHALADRSFGDGEAQHLDAPPR